MQAGDSEYCTAYLHSGVRTTQGVQNAVLKRLAAGVSLGLDVGGITSVCGDRGD